VAPPPIGANTWIWESPITDEILASLAPRLHSWGFDTVELPIENLGDWDPERTAELLTSIGLGASICIAMAPGRELCATDDGTIASTQTFLRHCVDAAVTIGSNVIAGPIYASVGRTWRMTGAERADLYRQLRASLEPVCDYAAERGVRVAVEPLVRYETSVINTVAQALEVVEGLAPEGCGLLVDNYHANVEERDVAAAFRLAGDRLAHVHLCANDRGAPGADHFDWPAIRDALSEIEYGGAVVIESFTAENEAIATAASVWRPLAESQDAIAVEGLAHLRQVFGPAAGKDSGRARFARATGVPH
jgi:D-psicose/D-tagatose/L-ribulose 3-epimerase